MIRDCERLCKGKCAQGVGDFEHCEIRDKVVVVRKLLDSLTDMREKLFDAHIIQSFKLFLEPYYDCDIDLFVESTYLQTDLREHAPRIINALKTANEEDTRDKVYQMILRAMVLMGNEYLGWVGASGLQALSAESDTFKKLYMDFTLFPFRVRFNNNRLNESTRQLRRLFASPTGNPDSKDIRLFYAILKEMVTNVSASTQTSKNWWGKRINPLDISDIDSMERRLAVLVLLFALGYCRQVYRDALRILDLKSTHLRDEFRIIHLQALIRERMKSTSNLEHRITQVIDIVDKCETWMKDDGVLDPRLLHLSSFAVGTLARHGWLNKYNRQWTIRRCDDAIKLIQRMLKATTASGHERTDLEHLAGTVLANKAYYLSVDGNRDDIAAAIAIYETHPLPNTTFTGLCMHNMGYAYLRYMECAETVTELDDRYKKASDCFEIASRRGYPYKGSGWLKHDQLYMEKKYKELQKAFGS